MGALVCIGLFVHDPSFPTPDKLLIFLTFVFMSLGQGWAVFKRLAPFVALLLVYESFRGVAEQLNNHINYTWMPHMDRWLFGNLPTTTLQGWLWHGHVQWYDFVFYLAYMLHFILPLGLALLIWKYREKLYWRYVATFLAVSFMGFVTFLAFPAAPPWLAAQNNVIPHIERISSHVWYALNLHDFPSVYNKISPNPVAAVPSLHAAYATLLVLFVWKLFGKKWGLAALVYPFLIFVGTVYQGEHYAIDIVIGIIYALIAYYLTALVFKRWRWLKAIGE